MQIVTTEFPFVWLRYTGSTHTDPARLIAEPTRCWRVANRSFF